MLQTIKECSICKKSHYKHTKITKTGKVRKLNVAIPSINFYKVKGENVCIDCYPKEKQEYFLFKYNGGRKMSRFEYSGVNLHEGTKEFERLMRLEFGGI